MSNEINIKALENLPEEKREETRKSLVKLYYDQAFQLVVDAAYELSFIEDYKKEIEEKKKEAEILQSSIKDIEDSPEHHTRQNRDLVKYKKETVEALNVSIKALEIKIENLPEQFKIACERADKHINKAKFIESYGK